MSEYMTLTMAVAESRAGNADALTLIMQSHNQRLFRIARGILRDSFEAEDIVQETFIKAFTNADALLDDTKITGWLGKITVNLARDRLRQRTRRDQLINAPENLDVIPINREFQQDHNRQTSPERQTAMGDVRKMIESEIDLLPDGFRVVFMMREVEQMSVEETAEMLEIPPNTVKTRLYRAKTLLRKGLEGRLNAESLNAFPFGGVHCARSTAHVIRYLQNGGTNP